MDNQVQVPLLEDLLPKHRQSALYFAKDLPPSITGRHDQGNPLQFLTQNLGFQAQCLVWKFPSSLTPPSGSMSLPKLFLEDSRHLYLPTPGEHGMLLQARPLFESMTFDLFVGEENG